MIHLFHKWGPWELGQAVYSSLFIGERTRMVQMRICLICKKTQVVPL